MDAWRKANAEAFLPLREALAAEEQRVAAQAYAFAMRAPGASLRSARAAAAEAINRLSRERLKRADIPETIKRKLRRGIA